MWVSYQTGMPQTSKIGSLIYGISHIQGYQRNGIIKQQGALFSLDKRIINKLHKFLFIFDSGLFYGMQLTGACFTKLQMKEKKNLSILVTTDSSF